MERARVLNSQFPPGFRFHPTDQELINHYLMRKVTASLPPDWTIIADIELYKHNPWDLPDKALFGRGEWFFFSPRDRKYPNGVRPNRATTAGYWKATGTDKPIMSAGSVQCIGVKKALVFYRGKPPKGIKTEWVMQEYRLLDSMTQPKTQNHPGSMRLDDWVLCRVRQKGKYETAQDTATSMCNIKAAGMKEEAAVAAARERCSSGEWSEHLSYFADSIPEDGENNSGEDSSSGLMWYGGGGGYTEVEQKQIQEEEDAPAIRTSKRKQSCGVLDELLMLQPGKKVLCGAETAAGAAATVVYDDEGVFQQYFL